MVTYLKAQPLFKDWGDGRYLGPLFVHSKNTLFIPSLASPALTPAIPRLEPSPTFPDPLLTAAKTNHPLARVTPIEAPLPWRTCSCSVTCGTALLLPLLFRLLSSLLRQGASFSQFGKSVVFFLGRWIIVLCCIFRLRVVEHSGFWHRFVQECLWKQF